MICPWWLSSHTFISCPPQLPVLTATVASSSCTSRPSPKLPAAFHPAPNSSHLCSVAALFFFFFFHLPTKMGICSSCACEGDHGSSSPTTTSTKVILEDGKLLELGGPVVRAAQVLSGEASERSFLCDADGMEFEGCVTAVGAGEELRPGQLYFVLPRSMLKRRLLPEEMAALAVRASAALLECGCAASSFVASAGREGWEEAGRRVAPVGGFSVGLAATAGRRRPMGKASGRTRNFSPMLGVISE
ncbi:hypothetical protein Taro_009453 [Colocasia esculenta]|uniref:Uncharacterized protein n=1 Tax=Colocasia esculenta TaxID=4460 RepID=A0A843U4Z2_COLES|nr:hypothetical protein [Colocasia esculenta]